MRLLWWSKYPMTGVPVRRGNFVTNSHRGRFSEDNKKGKDYSLQVQEGISPADILISNF